MKTVLQLLVGLGAVLLLLWLLNVLAGLVLWGVVLVGVGAVVTALVRHLVRERQINRTPGRLAERRADRAADRALKEMENRPPKA
jgi:hypothetical protein